jgi:hypothetical protein
VEGEIRGMSRRTIFIIVGAVVGVCVICGAIGVFAAAVAVPAIALTQAPADQGEKFMTLLKQGDYDGAYDLCTPALQKKLGNGNGLGKLITGGNSQPAKWGINNRNLSGDRADLKGDVTFTNSRAGTLDLGLLKVGSAWKVDSFEMKLK